MEQGGSWSGRERNCAYLNLGDGRFVNVSAVSGADYIDDSRAVVRIDWDGDGDLDLLLKGRTAPRLRVLRNEDSSGSHFLQVALTGSGANRDAIGALVQVRAGGKLYTRRLYAGDGFLSQSSKVLHFGLGKAEQVESVSVHWPDGTTESFEAPGINVRLRLVQGEGVPEPLAVITTPAFGVAESKVVSRREEPVRRIPLVQKLPVAALHIPGFEDQVRKVSDLSGSPVLINLWASWCQNCLIEMGHFKKRQAELSAQGLQIITMTTDEEEAYPAAKKILERYGLTEGAGYVDESLQATLDILFGEILGKTTLAALPASLLIDSSGQGVVFYNGPVEVDTLLADLNTLSGMQTANPTNLEFFGGVWLTARKRALGMMRRSFKRLGLEDMRAYYRELGQARRKYLEELQGGKQPNPEGGQ